MSMKLVAAERSLSRMVVAGQRQAHAEREKPKALAGPLSRPRKITLMLFLFNTLAVVAASAITTAFWSASWLLLCTATAWFAVAALTGAMSAWSRNQRAIRPVVVAGVITLAVCFVGSVALPDLRTAGNQVVGVILLSTVLAAISRSILTRLLPERVVLVTVGVQALPARWSDARANPVLVVDRASVNDPVAFSSRILASVEASDACSVEVVNGGDVPGEVLRHLSWQLRNRGTSLRLGVETGTLRGNRLSCGIQGEHAMMQIAVPTQPVAIRLAKRALDVAGSLILIVLLAPLLVLIGLVVKFTSPGDVVFRQVRVGKDGAPFSILKFRTMDTGADAKLQRLLELQETGNVPLFKVLDDPRITRVGRILRRFSLDELPQIFNVLRGDMSLVGPRPQRQEEVDLYFGESIHRLGVSPGMTGLWQVSGRSRLGWDEAQKLDVYYAHNWSLGLDIAILARTARAVVGADGAY